MSAVGGVENSATPFNGFRSQTVMNHSRREKAQPGMAVFIVIPGEELQGEGTGILERPKTFSWFGCHRVQQEGGVVVRGDATIHEDEGFRRITLIPLQDLRREIYRRRSTGADQLPERDPQIAVFAGKAVIFRLGVAADRPRRVSRNVLCNDQQKTAQVVRLKIGFWPEDRLQLSLQRVCRI